MRLFFQKLGQGKPIIILHGLYGCSDNWITIARKLADRHTIYLVDLRNHGRSPHHPVHSYASMVDDLDELIVSEQIEKPLLVGHSMGGKTAMLYAINNPEKLKGLIVVDIGPAGYASIDNPSPMVISHLNIINAMFSIDFKHYTNRTDIEIELAKTIKDIETRQFIMKNIQRNSDHTFSWKLNLEAISKALPEIMGPVKIEKALKNSQLKEFPVVFIKGERSEYISTEQQTQIYNYFPNATIETIANAGHWVHADQPELFLQKLNEILATTQFQ